MAWGKRQMAGWTERACFGKSLCRRSQVQVPGEGIAELGELPQRGRVQVPSVRAVCCLHHQACKYSMEALCTFPWRTCSAVAGWIFNQHKDCIILFGMKVSFIGEWIECVLLLSLIQIQPQLGSTCLSLGSKLLKNLESPPVDFP